MLQTGPSRTDQGFTLLEFLLVISILSIVSASFALSLDSAFSRSELQDIAAQLEGRLSHAARLARQSGRDQRVYINRSEGLAEFVIEGQALRISEPVLAEWVAAAEVGSSTQLGVIVFFGAGGSSGGTLTLSEGIERTDIAIDWLTARIRTSEAGP